MPKKIFISREAVAKREAADSVARAAYKHGRLLL